MGIETSCDDTSISILEDGRVIYESTLNDFKKTSSTGGIIPEVASRDHENNFVHILIDMVNRNVLRTVTHVSYTHNPGLPGSLHVGKVLAKTISSYLDVPLIRVNHLEAHIFSAFIENKYTNEDFLALVVSGGHSSIYKVTNNMMITELCSTTDDAVGEVYDKIARKLKMGFPGGPAIDKLFNKNKVNHDLIPTIKFIDETKLSFSGIKSSIINYINKNIDLTIDQMIELCSTFQYKVVNYLVERLSHFSNKTGIKKIVLGGGVACNSYLRELIMQKFKKEFVTLPSNRYCTDNATMICKITELKLG